MEEENINNEQGKSINRGRKRERKKEGVNGGTQFSVDY